MHPCLEIQEVTALICSFLSEEPQDLLSTALTCKILKDPALDTLWEELLEEIAFINLFPNDAWVEDPEGLIVPARDISAADWSSALCYTTRIRRIVVDHQSNWNPFLEGIAHSLTGTHIFPNLRQLTFDASVVGCIQYATSLLSPSLTHLALWSPDTEDGIAFVSQLGTLCPSLVSFAFDSYRRLLNDEPTPLEVCNALSKSILCWSRIQELVIPVLDRQTIRYLSLLPTFQHLELQRSYFEESIWPSSFSGFNALRSIEIRYLSLFFILQVLSSIQTRVLESIKIRPSEMGQFQWEEFYRVVSERSSLAPGLTLQMFSHTGMLSPSVEVDVLRPLFTARNLIDLYLPACHDLRLSDGFIEELARASPNLTRLDIGTVYSVLTRPLLTLNALRHLFRHCPKIQAVGLYINTKIDLLEDKELEEGQIQKHGQEFSLSVGKSKVKDVLGVAAFLLPFFNRPIWEIQTCHSASRSIEESWQRVVIALNYLIEERDRESKEESEEEMSEYGSGSEPDQETDSSSSDLE